MGRKERRQSHLFPTFCAITSRNSLRLEKNLLVCTLNPIKWGLTAKHDCEAEIAAIEQVSTRPKKATYPKVCVALGYPSAVHAEASEP